MQQVFEILLRRPVDKSIIAYLTDCKTSGLENTMEMVYPTGGQGNVYIGGGFAHSRRATFNVTVATWNTDVLAIQNGTEVATGSTEITQYDVISPVGGTYKTTFTAQGAVGSEVGFVYIVRDDGTYGKSYSQVQTVTAAGQFAYSTATKEITFFAGDEPEDGRMLAMSYQFRTADNAQKIVINSDGIPPTVLVSAYGIAKDVCTGELFHAVIEGQAQVDGNWNFDLAADGEPVVQNLAMEFVKGCISKELYTFTIYTEDEGDATKTSTPIASPVGGNYSAAQTVTLTSSTVGATIYYTLDGSNPTPASVVYSAPITIPAGATTVLKAIAVMAGLNDSDEMDETYIIS